MSPFNFLTRPAASSFRRAGRALELLADRIGPEAEADAEETVQDRPRRPQPRSDSQRTRQPKPLDDVAITRKVETEIFRDPGVPKGRIDVNTADGVVWLRGEAKTPEMINELERVASEVPEVERVENLLHLPKTPAPSRADTPRRQQKTRRSRARSSERRTTSRVTAEKGPPPEAEANPREVAGEGEGRPPSPLSDTESETGEDGG